MKTNTVLSLIAGVALLAPMGAMAIDANYARKLERSGCTQVTELQGCDINKTKEQNARAGFGAAAPAAAPASTASPYAGRWVAKATSGATVATIGIDARERVTLNGQVVRARRSDGALVFTSGTITYTIQGDPRLSHENSWFDADAQTTGPIRRE